MAMQMSSNPSTVSVAYDCSDYTMGDEDEAGESSDGSSEAEPDVEAASTVGGALFETLSFRSNRSVGARPRPRAVSHSIGAENRFAKFWESWALRNLTPLKLTWCGTCSERYLATALRHLTYVSTLHRYQTPSSAT